MTELPMDHWAQRREICLTLEEGPGGLSPIDSFIVLLSASEVVTPQQLRQTLVCKFLPAISWLQNKTNDTAKGGNRVFSRLCPKSQQIFVDVQQKIRHSEAWALLAPQPHIVSHCSGLRSPRLAAAPPGHPRGAPLLGSPSPPACPLDHEHLWDIRDTVSADQKGVLTARSPSQEVPLKPSPATED